MYWLLDVGEQDVVRKKVIDLQTKIIGTHKRQQREQLFPFIGRKDRGIAFEIIETLSGVGDTICDPFCGSGTFAYAALDCDREIYANDWEPYAFSMFTAPFRGVPTLAEMEQGMEFFKTSVKPIIDKLYQTRCPKCERLIIYDGLFFDREPSEYYYPRNHERMGVNGETIIFRQKYRCECGCQEKHYDDYDEAVRQLVEQIPVDFPDVKLIENSRLNFTSPTYTKYRNLFSHRQQVALIVIRDAIKKLPLPVRGYFEDTFLSIIHMGKYTDYRTKSQDNHCPANRLKETNLYFRFIEKLAERKQYIEKQTYNKEKVFSTCMDYRDFFKSLQDSSIQLVITDPPYGDNAQYFEHAQRVHPFMNFNLAEDNDRLMKEVVISNAPSRTDKHNKYQFMEDIQTLFVEAYRVISEHGYLVMYFRPEQSDWISDLNKLKHFARKQGFEPLVTIPIDNTDPSMRVLASAAWTFKNDICFIFKRLNASERRWYEGDVDVDELVYLAASNSATEQGLPFVISRFNAEMSNQLRKVKLLKLINPEYQQRIFETVNRFCINDCAQYRLNGLSPYNMMNKSMNAEIRLREFAPIVIEELTEGGRGFTFEEYVIHLSTYMENGSREIIEKLHTSNRLIPELLEVYAEENSEEGKFFAKGYSQNYCKEDVKYGRISLREMDPTEFEILIADYFIKRGFVKSQVIGRSCDRGVDVLATNNEGELELIQCKRYREGNNIGSNPIQRIDSYMRTREAKRAWVVTTSDFTPEGKDEARITGVIVINGKDLIKSLELYYRGMYKL